MIFPINFLIFVVILLGLCVAEFFVTKKRWTYGLILPICFTVIAIVVDRIIFIAVLALVVSSLIGLLVKSRQDKKRSEMEKMNIQDL